MTTVTTITTTITTTTSACVCDDRGSTKMSVLLNFFLWKCDRQTGLFLVGTSPETHASKAKKFPYVANKPRGIWISDVCYIWLVRILRSMIWTCTRTTSRKGRVLYTVLRSTTVVLRSTRSTTKQNMLTQSRSSHLNE